jgi:hypothetical protein
VGLAGGHQLSVGISTASTSEDGRFTNAILTKKGYTKLVAAAPALVATVRSLVIDCFSPTELGQLHKAAQRLVERLGADEASRQRT